MCEHPLNSTLFSPCSYFFIIVNYWAAVKYLSLCNTFATDSSHEIPRVLVFARPCLQILRFFFIMTKQSFSSGLIASVQCHGKVMVRFWEPAKNTSNLSPQFCIILLNLSSLKIMAFCFLRDLVTIWWFSKQNFFNTVVYPIPHGFLLPKAKCKVIEIVSHHEIFKHNPHGFVEPLLQTTFYCKNLHFIVNFQLQSNQGFLWIKSWIFKNKRLLLF